MATDRPLVPPIEPEGDRPGAYADVPDDLPRVRHLGWRVAALLAWVAVSYAVTAGLGVAGWQGGWAIALALWVAGLGVVAWEGLRSVPGRGLYVSALVILGLVAAVRVTDVAPESTARLAARIDHMGVQNLLWTPVRETRSGHGWCVPHCPDVTRVYRASNDSLRSDVAVALAALRAAGLERDLKTDYYLQDGPVIRRHDRHVDATLTLAEVRGRVELTIELRSR